MSSSNGVKTMYALLCITPTPWCVMAQTPRTVLFASNVQAPVAVAFAPGDHSRVFVLSRFGKITIHDPSTGVALPNPFLDLSPLTCCAANANIVGLAFDPGYASNGYFYVHYQVIPSQSVVARYRVTSDANIADPASATTILVTPRSAFGHNGGAIAFSPIDGYLYVPTGDSGNGAVADPANAAQDLSSPLGKVLRIDPGIDEFPSDPDRNYRIPPTNPFVNTPGALPEVWASGLRNPYQSTFDRATAEYYIADVGQDLREEVNAVPAASPGPLNFGWRCREGDVCSDFGGCECNSPALVQPIHSFDHSIGCSISGGRVYRGVAVPHLQGWYIYSDYCSGIIHAVRRVGGSTSVMDLTSQLRPSLPPFAQITSIGDDAQGELYITAIHNNVSGFVFKIAAAPTCPADVDDGTATGTPDGGVTIEDLLYYLTLFADGAPRADLDDGSSSGVPDGGVTIDDLLYYLLRFDAGC